jgi:hypothetical protein
MTMNRPIEQSVDNQTLRELLPNEQEGASGGSVLGETASSIMNSTTVSNPPPPAPEPVHVVCTVCGFG